MQKTVELFERWKLAPPQLVKLGKIKTDSALQPRVEQAIPLKDRTRQTEASAQHVDRLRRILQASSDQQLDPVLLADCDGGLFVVDGHHRLNAYRREMRREIPALVLRVTKQEALMISKLVNTVGLKLPMHDEQLREACWQLIVETHKRREVMLSNRKLAALSNVDKDTVASMKKQVERVNPADFDRKFSDPGTGWPRWRDVRGNAWKGGLEAMGVDQAQQWRAEKLAKKLGGIADKADPEVLRLALTLLKAEAEQAAREKLQQATDWDVLLPQQEAA